MHNDLLELGWTEEQWNRICSTVSEEAQKARVAAQLLPVVGPEDPTLVAVPPYTLTNPATPGQQQFPKTPPVAPQPAQRLSVDSDPTLNLTTIAINVELRAHEVADPELKAAL